MLGDICHAEKIYLACGYTDMRKSIDWKTGASNGRGHNQKSVSSPTGNSAGLWKGFP